MCVCVVYNNNDDIVCTEIVCVQGHPHACMSTSVESQCIYTAV